MCTCINIIANNTYFGRNLDLDYSFNERIIITPRNYLIKFKKEKNLSTHYALIGIGTVIDNYPLYADLINEEGLAFAGLNFPTNCEYYSFSNDKINITPFELPLYLLGTCKNIKEVKNIINNINIVNINFSNDVILSPLHFMISDKNESIVIETTKEGMRIYDNNLHVLTNNPPFTYHKDNIINYMQLHNDTPLNNITKQLKLEPYSFGQGAIGLPGDYSSPSRFIKAFFVKNFLELTDNDKDNINQFFKCLDSVSMIKGCVKAMHGYEYTRYTTCYNLNKKVLYYKTYDNPIINKIYLNKLDINSNNLILFNLYPNDQ